MHEPCPYPLVTIDDQTSIQFAMDQLGLWTEGEMIENAGRAGEGNMNSVLRVRTNHRCVILKQSRPWVEKYPDIAAPAERILAEIEFYKRVSTCEQVSCRMPKLLASHADLRLLALEDLGQATDYSDLYSTGRIEEMPIREVTAWLARLHAITIDPSDRVNVGNHALRQLNHAHIFVIPLRQPSAIPLDDVCVGLERLARDVRSDAAIHSTACELGEQYLGTGPQLLHGDCYPGSWLRTSAGLRVIDPEFTFAGPAEFDVGVLAAHCVLIGGGTDLIDRAVQEYARQGGAELDLHLLRGFAGMEIIRRLIGVAQLPLSATLGRRESMIQIAMSLLF